ncbi:MAG: Hsp70 family protein [Rhodopseudomonas sp.]|nr:Hsp70 family protein [Rhodopseudomonas sp.]
MTADIAQASATTFYCGIDFGTSNSTVSLATADRHFSVPVEGDAEAIPSAIFFNFTTGKPSFGRAAIRDYMSGENGRFMRALKSVIGRPIFHEKTYIGKRHVTLADILGLFLRHLKATTESQIGRDLDSVVLGRPVQFIENAADLDRKAQADLEGAARKVGFRHIEFQFEPIAAALEYETVVTGEQLILIVDIGGGTSDFSIVRVAPDRIARNDRSGDILANRGIRVGGTDFDRALSMQQVMPAFGHGSHYGDKHIEMPNGLYVDLSTWSNINAIYDRKIHADVKLLRRQAESPALLDRLLAVIEGRAGHRLIGDIERAKIDLSATVQTEIALDYIERGFSLPVRRDDFVTAIADLMARIEACIGATVADAGIAPNGIDTVFLTGGSSMALPVQALVRRLFPQAQVVSGDVFGAVGKGLGLDARRKFGR